MRWHKEMLRGLRDNAAYEVGRYVILLLWPFALAATYTGLSWLGTMRWNWRVNAGLLLIAVIILFITALKLIRQPHLFIRETPAEPSSIGMHPANGIKWLLGESRDKLQADLMS